MLQTKPLSGPGHKSDSILYQYYCPNMSQTRHNSLKSKGHAMTPSRSTRQWIILLILLQFSLFAQQPEDRYAARRQQVMDTMDSGVAILFSETSDGRANTHFDYLTGLRDPGAVLVLIPGSDVSEWLFHPSSQWPAAESSESAQVFGTDELDRRLSTMLRQADVAHVSFGNLKTLAVHQRAASRLARFENIDPIIVGMRTIKDPLEIDCLTKACEITAQALNDVFRAVQPGLRENDLAAILEYGLVRRGSTGSSFLQSASGPNAVNIHFGATDRKLEEGDIIVFDIGGYWKNYTSDISRTIPASGRFTKEQAEIYQVVLNSQKAAIKMMVPGTRMVDVQQCAEDVLINGLYDLGLVLDTTSEWQRRFFIQHGFYHFIGLDVHDVWYDYRVGIEEKTYQPGMIMTMEPGLYFPPGRLDSRPGSLQEMVSEETFLSFAETIRPVYDKYVHIGVRIEDDVLITEEGNHVLTDFVPKEIRAIEKMMRQKSPHNVFSW